MLNEIQYIADYFPYGKVLREYVNGDKERYLTTQHERDNETGLDYRGARYYDSDVARFLSLDPLASDYPSWSDYNYVMGNPIVFVDPDGREAKSNISGWDTEGHRQLAEAFGTVSIKYKDNNETNGEGDDDKPKPKTSTMPSKSNRLIGRSNYFISSTGSLIGLSSSSFRLINGSVFSPKIYLSGWAGGSRARIKTFSFTKIGRSFGSFTFFVGFGMDVIGVYDYYKYGANSSNAVHPSKFGLNTYVGVWGLAGGFGGTVFAPIYFGLEAFYPGGFFQAITDKSNRDKKVTKVFQSASGDKTRYFNSFNLSDHGGIFKQ